MRDWLRKISGIRAGAPYWKRDFYIFLFLLAFTVFYVIPVTIGCWGYVVWFMTNPNMHGDYVISTGLGGMPCSK